MIDPELQAQLRAKYNPDGSDLRRLQLRMLEMLKYIDKICRENNITYWLSSGTCLGAVRHGGFIPWDDDVDIEMLEPDYRKFLRVMGNEPRDGYILQSRKNDDWYCMDFVKLRDITGDNMSDVLSLSSSYKYKGIFVDIFKLVPSNSRKIHYFCSRIRIVQGYIQEWAVTRGLFHKIIFKVFQRMVDAIIALLTPVVKLGSGNQLRHTLGVPFLKPRFRSDIFPIRFIAFENVLMPVPNQYDEYLSKLYNDYLSLKLDHNHFVLDMAKRNI